METMLNPNGVIVADDDPIVRGILRAKLEAIHRDVLLASDGTEAIALASQTQVGLVILDIAMPRLDGILACARIRQLPGYATTPIVMLTSNQTGRARDKASCSGATMFIEKPFESASLMLALSRLLPIDAESLRAIEEEAAPFGGTSLMMITEMRSRCSFGEPA
jgi:CheY-like chemotaxis protein